MNSNRSSPSRFLTVVSIRAGLQQRHQAIEAGDEGDLATTCEQRLDHRDRLVMADVVVHECPPAGYVAVGDRIPAPHDMRQVDAPHRLVGVGDRRTVAARQRPGGHNDPVASKRESLFNGNPSVDPNIDTQIANLISSQLGQSARRSVGIGRWRFLSLCAGDRLGCPAELAEQAELERDVLGAKHRPPLPSRHRHNDSA